MKSLMSAGVLLILAGSLAARAPSLRCFSAAARLQAGTRPLGDPGRIRSLADRDHQLGPLGQRR